MVDVCACACVGYIYIDICTYASKGCGYRLLTPLLSFTTTGFRAVSDTFVKGVYLWVVGGTVQDIGPTPNLSSYWVRDVEPFG